MQAAPSDYAGVAADSSSPGVSETGSDASVDSESGDSDSAYVRTVFVPDLQQIRAVATDHVDAAAASWEDEVVLERFVAA